MKLQFSANQEYQIDAIQAAVRLFEGQPAAGHGEIALLSGSDAAQTSLQLTDKGLGNRLTLTEEQLLKNLHAIQHDYGLPKSQSLERVYLENDTEVGSFPNFTVEMETGTGKTYVYLRTIYELHKTYGFKKFVIVVPSVAIREGVLKSLQITHDHLQSLYSYEPVSFSVYDSGKVNSLRNFALSNAVQILVINIDSFAKDAQDDTNNNGKKKKSKGNVINQLRETGIRPIEFIQASNPIVILDEPQNLETDIRKMAIGRLNPLCALRYSATHRNTYNLIYKLDPIRAYELGLVKQIGVDSVIELRDANQTFVEIEGFKTGKRSISAKLKIWVNGPSGPDKKSFTVKNGDDLYNLSKERETYKNSFIVNEIDADEGFVRFANDVTVRLNQPHGAITDTILKTQIEATIKRHFDKESKLRQHGIKVLSVFFIDRVAHYREYTEDGTTRKGKFAEWFEEIFQKYASQSEYANLYPWPVEKLHNGYFAQDKKIITPFEEKEGKTNTDAESSTFELIMRDKERLLDQNEPLRFIFSHSALREGWDNPNVFQICTLVESSSETKKRQEIGRGLRLCVNHEGERIMDRNLNRLTVVANEAYEDFAKTLQTEMAEAGVAFKKEMIQNEKEKVTVRLKKGYALDENFKALWERIKQRTRYRVSYKTNWLIDRASEKIASMEVVERPKIAIARAEIDITQQGVTSRETGRRTQEVVAKYIMPDFVTQIQARTGLSKSTIASTLLKSQRLQDAVNNPQLFIDHVSTIINAVKRELLVQGVEYFKVGSLTYEMRRFETDDLIEVFESNVIAVRKQDKTLFSHIIIDSNSSPEREFAKACEDNDDVHFYLKLPKWFQIETPVGTYNPDWALVYKNDQTLYFVAETKGTSKQGVQIELLRPLEALKIECGKRHFKEFEQVQFKVVRTLAEVIGV
jgi:type III restriction enzyme